MQIKDLALDECELKFVGRSGSFEGYASVFNGVDAYGDTIAPGAYKDTLATRKRPPLMLLGHNPGRVIGKWTGLAEDSKGLHVRGELTPGHTDAEDTAASLRHGAMGGLSIGYRLPEGGFRDLGGNAKAGEAQRALIKIDLVEISVVSMPADDDARIDFESVKSMIEGLNSIREVDEFLRDVGGFSKSGATALLSRIKAITQGDPGETAELRKKVADLERQLGVKNVRDVFASVRIPASLSG